MHSNDNALLWLSWADAKSWVNITVVLHSNTIYRHFENTCHKLRNKQKNDTYHRSFPYSICTVAMYLSNTGKLKFPNCISRSIPLIAPTYITMHCNVFYKCSIQYRVVLGYDIVCNSVTLFVVDQNLSVAQWKAQSNPKSIPDKYLVIHSVGKCIPECNVS